MSMQEILRIMENMVLNSLTDNEGEKRQRKAGKQKQHISREHTQWQKQVWMGKNEKISRVCHSDTYP